MKRRYFAKLLASLPLLGGTIAMANDQLTAHQKQRKIKTASLSGGFLEISDNQTVYKRLLVTLYGGNPIQREETAKLIEKALLLTNPLANGLGIGAQRPLVTTFESFDSFNDNFLKSLYPEFYKVSVSSDARVSSNSLAAMELARAKSQALCELYRDTRTRNGCDIVIHGPQREKAKPKGADLMSGSYQWQLNAKQHPGMQGAPGVLNFLSDVVIFINEDGSLISLRGCYSDSISSRHRRIFSLHQSLGLV